MLPWRLLGSIEERAPRAAAGLAVLAGAGVSIWTVTKIAALFKEIGDRFGQKIRDGAVAVAFGLVVLAAAYVVIEF